jgi:FkbM family methyltransferase
MAKDIHGFFFKTPLESTFLAWQIQEIFKDQIYAPFLQGKSDLTILDIGAFYGNASYYFSPFAKTIYAFEPTTESFEVLNFQLDFNEIKNVKPFQMAISNQDGESIFYHQVGNKTMNSLTPVIPTQNTEQVKTIRLDTFFKQEGIGHVDLMKLDVEGEEAEIVCGDAFANVADKIDTIVCEVHSWMGRNRNQLLEGFKNNGFKTKQIENEADIIVAYK